MSEADHILKSSYDTVMEPSLKRSPQRRAAKLQKIIPRQIRQLKCRSPKKVPREKSETDSQSSSKKTISGHTNFFPKKSFHGRPRTRAGPSFFFLLSRILKFCF